MLLFHAHDPSKKTFSSPNFNLSRHSYLGNYTFESIRVFLRQLAFDYSNPLEDGIDILPEFFQFMDMVLQISRSSFKSRSCQSIAMNQHFVGFIKPCQPVIKNKY